MCPYCTRPIVEEVRIYILQYTFPVETKISTPFLRRLQRDWREGGARPDRRTKMSENDNMPPR